MRRALAVLVAATSATPAPNVTVRKPTTAPVDEPPVATSAATQAPPATGASRASWRVLTVGRGPQGLPPWHRPPRILGQGRPRTHRARWLLGPRLSVQRVLAPPLEVFQVPQRRRY